MPARRFISEGTAAYGKYQFGYRLWMELDESDSLAEAYNCGFLPFSGEPSDPRHLFYMARSLRVRTSALTIDKKRRYDHRKWADFGLTRALMDKNRFFARFGEKALTSAIQWMQSRFGDAYLSPKRLHYIIGKPFLKEILVWTSPDGLEAFALIVRGDWGAHYWYVFYRNEVPEATAPGHGYLVDFLDWARSEGLPHAYIGTGYGLRSRYKSRGITGVEFWDGNAWSADKDQLVQLQEDDERAAEQ